MSSYTVNPVNGQPLWFEQKTATQIPVSKISLKDPGRAELIRIIRDAVTPTAVSTVFSTTGMHELIERVDVITDEPLSAEQVQAAYLGLAKYKESLGK